MTRAGGALFDRPDPRDPVETDPADAPFAAPPRAAPPARHLASRGAARPAPARRVARVARRVPEPVPGRVGPLRVRRDGRLGHGVDAARDASRVRSAARARHGPLARRRARPGRWRFTTAPRTTADSCTTAPASSARTTPRRGTAYPACTAASPRHGPPRSTRRAQPGGGVREREPVDVLGAPRGAVRGARRCRTPGGPGAPTPTGSIPVGGAHAPYDMAMGGGQAGGALGGGWSAGYAAGGAPRGWLPARGAADGGSCWTRCAAARR